MATAPLTVLLLAGCGRNRLTEAAARTAPVVGSLGAARAGLTQIPGW